MVMEPNSSFGIDKVRKTENYAFIWDSAVLEYETQREPCNTLKLLERFVCLLSQGPGCLFPIDFHSQKATRLSLNLPLGFPLPTAKWLSLLLGHQLKFLLLKVHADEANGQYNGKSPINFV